jgi:2-polyprenyl-6-methoxyphenol hydroxylase-like FAD-dependent oxidoreductase
MRQFGPCERAPTALTADVTIVGGGPVGCVTALAFARAGARVCLIDPDTPSNRLAGEWLHPTGAGILADLGVDLTGVEHSIGRGFAIFPKGDEPIVLPYAGGERGIGCQRHHLLHALRETVARHADVTLLSGYRAAEVARGCVRATGPEGSTVCVGTELIVGADGRQSAVRQALGYSGACRPVSYMVGLLIDPAALPFSEYGNVLLGGPGPVLAFRVGATRARVCIDVPADRVAWVRNPAELLAAYRPALPADLYAECARALASGPPGVAANQLLPRRQYGRAGIALVGDAVGHCHPLCAVGMSVGFLDARALARCGSVEEYAALRSTAGRVPELLSTGLYDLFVGADEGTAGLRAAVYHLWRTSGAARRDTMRLLAIRETRRSALGVTFARLLSVAARQVAADALTRPVRRTAAAVAGFACWAGWFARETLAR